MWEAQEMWVNHEHVRWAGEAGFVSSPPPYLLPVIAELDGPGVCCLGNGFTGDLDRGT